MANTAVTQSTFEQFSSLSQLHIVRQLVFMLVMAAAIALGIAIVMWSRGTNYTALYMSLSPQESAEIASALQQSNIDFEINTGAGVISVPENEIERVRLQLASQGLPRNSNAGYEILNQDQSLNTSNFMEQARFNHALEQELANSIKYIRSVRDARVHLSIPRQSSFLRSNNNATASVMLNLVEGLTPGNSQLAGIVHLVASSVSGLAPENVSIIDQNGNLLSKQNNSEYNTSSEHLRITRSIEEDYTNRILNILSPVVGRDNVRAQVSADIDFTSIETTQENFNPNTIAVRSEQVQEERSGISTETSVEPGTLSDTPPDTESEETANTLQTPAQSMINSTRNYEVDRVVSHSKNVPGSISRLSVAVLVDLDGSLFDTAAQDDVLEEADAVAVAAPTIDQERLDRLTQLVRDTIGYNEIRGDSVSVISEQFSSTAPLEFEDNTPLWQQSWVMPMVKQILASLAVIFLIFGVLRPALKSTVSPSSNLPKRLSAGSHDGNVNELANDSVELSGEATEQSAQMLAPPKSKYDENLATAQQLVQNEPVRAARMIKEWVADD